MPKVFLGLGTNVGDRQENIRRAIALLGERIADMRAAPVYISRAVGYADQPDFLNTAVSGDTELAPEELLGFIKKTEQSVGRVARFRWGPREIDIDILFYDNLVYASETLEIPHPRLHERDFVLRPLCDLESELVHPRYQKTIAELLAKLPQENLSIIRMVAHSKS